MKNLRKILSSSQWLWSSITNNMYLPLWWIFSIVLPVVNPKYMLFSIFFYDFGFFLFSKKNRKDGLLKFYKNSNFSKIENDLSYLLSHLACLGATGLIGTIIFLLFAKSTYPIDSQGWVSYLGFRSLWGFFICFLLTRKQKEKTILLLSLIPTLLISLNLFTAYKIPQKIRYFFTAFIPNIDNFDKTDFFIVLPLILTMIILVIKRNEHNS